MSMRGSANEENCTESSSKPVAENDSRHSIACLSPSTSTKYAMSPLLRIFSSKEVVPVALEYEKALLVMKEHDYAKSPDRSEILKLSSLLGEPFQSCQEQREEVQPVEAAASDVNTLLSTRKDLLLLRGSLSKREDNFVSNNLRAVVSMQIDLIREQQEQLHCKDKELNTVRKDKEQLEARLERMERRLAILQKHSRSKYENSEPESPQQSTSISSLVDSVGSRSRVRSYRDSLINSDQHCRSRSNSNDRASRISRSSRVSSHSGTPVPQDIQELTGSGSGSGKRNTKRKLNESITAPVETPKRKKQKQNEIRTMLEYSGLDLLVPHLPKDASNDVFNNCDDFKNNTAELANSLRGCDHEGESGSGLLNGNDTTILVPSWKISTVKGGVPSVTSEYEELSDEAFNKRHKKPEDDEKRRKRWDIQRARTLRNHEELLKRYNQKGGGGVMDKTEKKKEKINTFIPKLSEVQTIEIKDSIAVTAFGMPLPLIKPKEFELSWFDLDAREAKESIRTTRARSRASTTMRLSVGSSAEEDSK